MTSSTTSERWRVPYRLGTDYYCTYEDEGEESYVHIGDRVTVCYQNYVGNCECSGELGYVMYSCDGFIDSVVLFPSDDDDDGVEVPCEGLFYRCRS